MKYLLCLALVGCASEPAMTEQELVMDKKIQSIGRNEAIVDVTCGPRYY